MLNAKICIEDAEVQFVEAYIYEGAHGFINGYRLFKGMFLHRFHSL